MVAGWCQHCGKPFVVAHERRHLDGWPSTCSLACAKAAIRTRARARALLRAPCWACWKEPATRGRMCVWCYSQGRTACQAMCRWKVRLDARSARRLVEKIRLREGVTTTMRPYLCPVCGSWHVGHEPAQRLQDKRAVLVATLYIANMDPDALQRLYREWEPQHDGPSRCRA